jgi:hypothetical protein
MSTYRTKLVSRHTPFGRSTVNRGSGKAAGAESISEQAIEPVTADLSSDLDSDTASYRQSLRSANKGITLLHAGLAIAEELGVLIEQLRILVQHGTDTGLGPDLRAQLEQEMQALTYAIDNVVEILTTNEGQVLVELDDGTTEGMGVEELLRSMRSSEQQRGRGRQSIVKLDDLVRLDKALGAIDTIQVLYKNSLTRIERTMNVLLQTDAQNGGFRPDGNPELNRNDIAAVIQLAQDTGHGFSDFQPHHLQRTGSIKLLD